MDVLIGMGGGKTIDTAKIAADRGHTGHRRPHNCVDGCPVQWMRGAVYKRRVFVPCSTKR